MEREPTRLTDDDRELAALQRLEASNWDDHLTDTEARLIASRRHGGQASAMYSFCSSGAIDLEELTLELRLETDIALANNEQDDALAVEALWKYVDAKGDRPPVEGWHESTRW